MASLLALSLRKLLVPKRTGLARAFAFITTLTLSYPVYSHPFPHNLPPKEDGVYGRFAGDLELSLGFGARLETGAPQASFYADAHYFSSAGLYVNYADAFNSKQPKRMLSFGIDLRPLFIPRWALDLEHGPRFLDLTIDSISLNLGMAFVQPETDAFERGFVTGVGIGLPLLGKAEGLWLDLRATGTWLDSERPWMPSATALLSWRALILTPLLSGP